MNFKSAFKGKFNLKSAFKSNFGIKTAFKNKLNTFVTSWKLKRTGNRLI